MFFTFFVTHTILFFGNGHTYIHSPLLSLMIRLRVVHKIKVAAPITSLALTHDEKILLVGLATGRLIVYCSSG
jgi:hypothetical protein